MSQPLKQILPKCLNPDPNPDIYNQIFLKEYEAIYPIAYMYMITNKQILMVYYAGFSLKKTIDSY